ncbi:MAG: carboxylating nicotinate-nucleotide diphosphorylase [Chloroflexi bacterium]|nr:carboxylating nicotinate-nucleotide diphosphorylase [Chloroflexota bacterium]
MKLVHQRVEEIVRCALTEDLAWGDVTTDALVPPDAEATSRAIFKRPGVLAGIDVFALVFQIMDPGVETSVLVRDGSRVERGEAVAVVQGPAASILRAERTALNFLQRMSGIATETARYVEAVAGLPVRVIHTRKTVPGLRVLDRYAVGCGGGLPHRFNLSDGVLIKDNHLAVLRKAGKGIREAVELTRQSIHHGLVVEVEVENLEEAREALESGAEVILLDNMTPEQARECVLMLAGRAKTEASGGINLGNVRAFAEAGVDIISVGALTHSSHALDISLDFEVA